MRVDEPVLEALLGWLHQAGGVCSVYCHHVMLSIKNQSSICWKNIQNTDSNHVNMMNPTSQFTGTLWLALWRHPGAKTNIISSLVMSNDASILTGQITWVLHIVTNYDTDPVVNLRSGCFNVFQLLVIDLISTTTCFVSQLSALTNLPTSLLAEKKRKEKRLVQANARHLTC